MQSSDISNNLIQEIQEMKRKIKRLESIRLGQSVPASTLGELNDIYLRELNNLSDLADVIEARVNLGLGSMALEDTNLYYLKTAVNSLLSAKANKAGETFTGAMGFPITTVTNNVTLNASHHTVLCDASANPISVTLPGAGTCQSRMYYIKVIDNTNNVTVIPNGVQTIDGQNDYSLNILYETVHIQSDGANWWILGVPAVFVS